MKPKETNRRFARELIEWVESLVFATALVILLFIFCFRAITVAGSSMCNTLREGDKVIIQSLGYQPCRGDIVVMDWYIDYGKPIVKRIIALGGDVVDIDFDRGVVTVNGQPLDEPYILNATLNRGDVQFPLTVPAGKVFVMGDNRRVSLDSRFSEIGCIDTRDILGRVFFRILPFQTAGVVR